MEQALKHFRSIFSPIHFREDLSCLEILGADYQNNLLHKALYPEIPLKIL